MPGSRASVFGEAEDFHAALSAGGVAGLLVSGRGQFRARMTQVALEGIRLAAVEEQLARIAFIAVPAGIVVVAFQIDGGPSPVWGGTEIRRGEIIAFGPGQRLHARTVGHRRRLAAACKHSLARLTSSWRLRQSESGPNSCVNI